MKILLISGFLGAGKTSFIKAMAKATGREFVIVENEFAEADVDAQLLSQDEAAARMEVWEIAEGCICCSLDLDFSLSVLTIANTLNPDYLLVEPSGVAQPTQIIKNLSQIEYERISLLAPVTVVDGHNFYHQRQEFRNYFEDQLIAAGTIVLSKSEALSPAEFSEIQAQLDLPDDVSFPLSHYSTWEKADWLRLLNTDFSGDDIARVGERFKARAIVREADRDLENITLPELSFVNPDALYHFLEQLSWGHYGKVIRAKGFVQVQAETLYVELVSNQFSFSGLGELDSDQVEAMEVQHHLVIIGKQLDRQALQAHIR